MAGEYRIILAIALFMGGAVYGAMHMPPLTSRSPSASDSGNPRSYEVIFGQEFDHCRDRPNSYDCRCFARISGRIQAGTDANPKPVTGVTRMDRKILARNQAADSCARRL